MSFAWKRCVRRPRLRLDCAEQLVEFAKILRKLIDPRLAPRPGQCVQQLAFTRRHCLPEGFAFSCNVQPLDPAVLSIRLAGHKSGVLQCANSLAHCHGVAAQDPPEFSLRDSPLSLNVNQDRKRKGRLLFLSRHAHADHVHGTAKRGAHRKD